MDINRLHAIIRQAKDSDHGYFVLSRRFVTQIHTRDKFGLVQITTEEAGLLQVAAKEANVKQHMDGSDLCLFKHDVYIGRYKFLKLMHHAVTLANTHDTAIARILSQPWPTGLVRQKRTETIEGGGERGSKPAEAEVVIESAETERLVERAIRRSFQHKVHDALMGWKPGTTAAWPYVPQERSDES